MNKLTKIKLEIFYLIESLCFVDEIYDIQKLNSATAVVNVKK